MAAYKIITDSCCDFTNQQYQELDVTYTPLSVMFKGELLRGSGCEGLL